MKNSNKLVEECPECGAEVRFRRTPFVGQEVTCRKCKAQLEVISVQPLQIDVIFDDYDDDDYEGYVDDSSFYEMDID